MFMGMKKSMTEFAIRVDEPEQVKISRFRVMDNPLFDLEISIRYNYLKFKIIEREL